MMGGISPPETILYSRDSTSSGKKAGHDMTINLNN
jgi:hypothetical protein